MWSFWVPLNRNGYVFKRKILIAAGGTGGHLIPAQQLAEQLQNSGDVQVLFGGYKLTQSPYFHRDRFAFTEIASSPRLSRPFALIKGILQALRLLAKEKPESVVGFGSYHSAPLLVAAVLLRKKIFLYEANRTMGKVNRWIAPFAHKIGCRFPVIGAVDPKYVRTLLFSKKAQDISPMDARSSYGLDPEKFTLLVFGGSQGAAFLNEIMPKVATRLQNVQILHFAGTESAAEAVQKAYTVPVVVKAFETNMQNAYSAADFVVGRSGSGTIAELIQFAVPSLLIPYPYAADLHQQVNAEYLCALGGALVLSQPEANLEAIVACIQSANLRAMQLDLREVARQNDGFTEFYQQVLHG